MTAKEKLVREYAETHSHQIICMDKADYGDCITVVKRERSYFIIMTDIIGKQIIVIRSFTTWRDAKRAYTALAYEP